MRRALRRRRQPHADECSFASCDLNMLSAFHNYNEARTFCTTSKKHLSFFPPHLAPPYLGLLFQLQPLNALSTHNHQHTLIPGYPKRFNCFHYCSKAPPSDRHYSHYFPRPHVQSALAWIAPAVPSYYRCHPSPPRDPTNSPAFPASRSSAT